MDFESYLDEVLEEIDTMLGDEDYDYKALSDLIVDNFRTVELGHANGDTPEETAAEIVLALR